MRVLTINYPKTPNDEKKVSYLKLKYDEIIKDKTTDEAALLELPKLDEEVLKLTYAPMGV